MKYILFITLFLFIVPATYAEQPNINQLIPSAPSIRLNSIGYRWTQDLEGDSFSNKARIFATVKIEKNHKLKFAWEMGKLGSPTDMFNGGVRKDAIMTEYEYTFD